MPKVFLKKRNRGGHKTYMCVECKKPIEPGEEYFTWKFNFGERHAQHATHGQPRRSQLSPSKMAVVWDAVDDFDVSGAGTPSDIAVALERVAAAARDVAAEYAEAADNIESSWPSGNATSEACRATADELEEWADQLETWQPDEEEFVKKDSLYEDRDEWLEALRQDAMDLAGETPEYQG